MTQLNPPAQVRKLFVLVNEMKVRIAELEGRIAALENKDESLDWFNVEQDEIGY